MFDVPESALPPSPVETDPTLSRIHDPLALPGDTLEELELAGSDEGYQYGTQRAYDPDAPQTTDDDADADEDWGDGADDLEDAEDDGV